MRLVFQCKLASYGIYRGEARPLSFKDLQYYYNVLDKPVEPEGEGAGLLPFDGDGG